ncbi:hypothetical protein Acor_67840 [Acrocarpospora corrugata]|uniref:Uncharacterized protein n=1 Tax=Acrocarpospora corrugata TaxID=35763 RepID=A0A5M3W7C7_9ACTN|nr:hypothetical protein Acor_67840 [Acrocarpospora corrugata]
MGTTTAWRYVREAITLLARRSPSLDQALWAAERPDYAFVVLDGTLIPIDRVAADRPYHSGKNRANSSDAMTLLRAHSPLLQGIRASENLATILSSLKQGLIELASVITKGGPGSVGKAL